MHLVYLESEAEIGHPFPLEHNATAQQHVAGVDVEAVPVIVLAEPWRTVLAPGCEQPLMLGADGSTLLFADAFGGRRLGS